MVFLFLMIIITTNFLDFKLFELIHMRHFVAFQQPFFFLNNFGVSLIPAIHSPVMIVGNGQLEVSRFYLLAILLLNCSLCLC